MNTVSILFIYNIFKKYSYLLMGKMMNPLYITLRSVRPRRGALYVDCCLLKMDGWMYF